MVDGFPRSALQADVLKLLYEKLLSVHNANPDHAPRPIFKVVVLYISEEESVRRQVERAVAARERNIRVMDAGVGDTEEVRATDMDVEKAKLRYTVFKENYVTLLRLMQVCWRLRSCSRY